MSTASSFPFLPGAGSYSCSIDRHSRSRDGLLSAPGLLPCAVSLPVVLNADHKGQAQVVRTPVWNYCQVSNSDNPRGLHSFTKWCGRRLENKSSLVSAGYETEAVGSQVATANELQNGSPAQSSGTVRERPELLRDGKQGLWTVVIPTYNRLPILTKCLQALEEQRDYFVGGIESYEVIVVDDGSTDGTAQFLRDGHKNTATLGRWENSEVSSLNRMASDTDCDTTASGTERKDLGCWGTDNRCNLEECTYEGLEHRSVVQNIELFPHARLVQQKHGGATRARNLGLKHAKGAVIVFIDSDLIVTETFLKAHGEALKDAFLEDGNDRAFTYGRVVNTSNFDDPKSENIKLTDYSAAFFATGNVAISHRRLLEAGELLGCDADGPFDAQFSEYGWEDLELGVRLKQCGARIKHAPAAVGYHWHPPFSVEQLPKLIEQERQRGRNGFRFYRKHPTLNVQLMIQMTPFHEFLWFLLTLGGLINEKTLEPILHWLVLAGKHRTAAALVSPILNWHTVQAVKEESRRFM